MDDIKIGLILLGLLRELEDKAREASSAAATKLETIEQYKMAGKANGFRIAQSLIRHHCQELLPKVIEFHHKGANQCQNLASLMEPMGD